MAPQGRRGVSRGVFQVIISSFVLLGSTNFPLRKALHLRSSGNITRRPRDAAKGSDFRPQPCLHEPTRLHTSGLHRLHRLRGGSGESLEQALRSSLVGLSEGERKAAEAAVFALEKQPGFLHALLSILAKYKTEPGNISMQAAAIRFKNTIREHWAYDPEGNEPEFTITETEKKEVREIILQAMCEVSPVAQRQLAESVRLIAVHEFPRQWPELIQEITERLRTNLQASNLGAILGLVETMDVVMTRFKGVAQSKELVEELRFCLETFQKPLLDSYTTLVPLALTSTHLPLKERLKVLKALKYLTGVYVSMNSLTIPEFFEDHIGEWMDHFHVMMSKLEAPRADMDGGFRPGDEIVREIVNVQTVVIEALTVYAEKYEEEFKPFLPQLTQDIWLLAVERGPDPALDGLVTNALAYLTTVAGQPWNRGLFEPEGAVSRIIKQICVPNLKMRSSDRESFRDTPYVFARENMDGSLANNRARAATELIRRLLVHFDAHVTSLCLSHIESLLASYRSNPNEWQDKYTAVSLFLAVAVKGSTRSHGATTLNTAMPVTAFLKEHVISSLTSGGPDSFPELKALLIKAVITFRTHLPADDNIALFEPLIELLNSNSYVVHTYAASAIDRLVTMAPISDKSAKVLDRAVVGRVVLKALDPLLRLANSPLYPKEKWPFNSFAMRALTDLLVQAPIPVTLPLLPALLRNLALFVRKIAENPEMCSSSWFTHYLFESIAVIVRRRISQEGRDTAVTDEAARVLGVVGRIEADLFPVFQVILQNQNEDLMPYVFQIMALLLEAAPGEISATYLALFEPILAPCNWQMAGNVAGLVRLLQAYLQKGTSQLLTANARFVERIIEVADGLMTSRRTEPSGMKLLTGLIEALDPALLRPHMPQILRLALRRLKSGWERPLVRRFAPLMDLLCVTVGKHGLGFFVEALESPGDLRAIQRGFWADFLPKIVAASRRKAGVIATVRMLAEDSELWADLPILERIVRALVETLLASAAAVEAGEKEIYLSMLEDVGDGGVKGTRLVHSRDGHHDAFAEVKKPEEFVVQGLAKLSQMHPKVLVPILERGLRKEKLESLETLCSKAGVQFA
ncbi:hypothetical protein AAMO2058_000045900 [Amorphochlora amoebiformis]